MNMLQLGAHRYQAAANPAYAKVNQRRLALLVGLVALLLPAVLLLASLVGNVFPGLSPSLKTCFRDSISHYYYAPFWGGPFVGSLVFIASFLFVYRGEDRAGAEARLSTMAGFAALGVAIFPTSGSGCIDPTFASRAFVNFTFDGITLAAAPQNMPDRYFEMAAWAEWIHYGSAFVLFAFLAWFAFAVFTAADEDQKEEDGSLKQAKILRNVFYYACGTIIIASMIALGAHFFFGGDGRTWNASNWTFWCELAALWAFGLSWMVKGRFLQALEDKQDRKARSAR